MKRTQLRFERLQQVVGSSELSVIMLTDEARQRVLAVVCDEIMAQQLNLRINNPQACSAYVPEVLVRMLSTNIQMLVVGIFDGQYQVLLMDMDSGITMRIRMSDAVLLMLASRVPLYIEESLMQKQSHPFDENANGVAIPINTMDTKGLRMALERAVDEEDYEFASQIRDEINRRTDKDQ